jgi:hypothetical protein
VGRAETGADQGWPHSPWIRPEGGSEIVMGACSFCAVAKGERPGIERATARLCRALSARSVPDVGAR